MFLTETQRSLVVMSLRFAGEHYKENARVVMEPYKEGLYENLPIKLRDIHLQQAKDVESIADQIDNSFSVEVK